MESNPRTLFSPLPILTALVLILPWFIAIYFVSDGAFYAEALGKDFGSKIGSAQETHGGWPGYYALTTGLMFWPGVIALPIASIWTWKNRTDASVTLLLCWLVPMWIMLELVPTKLPHYTLPIYPALALLCGAALVRFPEARLTRWVGASLFLIVASCLIYIASWGLSVPSGLMDWTSLSNHFRPLPPSISWALAIAAIMATLLFLIRRKLAYVLAFGGALQAVFFSYTMPRDPMFWASNEIMRTFTEESLALTGYTTPSAFQGTIVSPDFREPSLVYLAGTTTRLNLENLYSGDTLVIERDVMRLKCATYLNGVMALNYAAGDPVDLSVYATDDCAPEALETWRAREVARRADNK